MKKSITTSLSYSHNYNYIEKNNSEQLYLLLHGFQQDAEYMIDTFQDLITENILSVNAPFICPSLRQGEYQAKYAWYFFDPKNSEYLIGMEPAVSYIHHILKKENLLKKKITIIGYSQGGYLAPKIAHDIINIETIIGLACNFRSKNFTPRTGVSYNQINSKDDYIIDYKSAVDEFNKIPNNTGKFITINDSGHRIDQNYLNQLKEIIMN